MPPNDTSSWKPVPTRLLLLDQIHEQEPGTKIRALGCVHAYHVDSATLVLKLQHPDEKARAPTVLANILNVLEAADHELLQTGSWLNVVGYVRKPDSTPRSLRIFDSQRSNSKHRKRSMERIIPLVDVTMLWSAGAVKLADYESALRSYQDTLPR